jgi:hypothetical protein
MILHRIWRSLSAVVVGAGLAAATPAHAALSPLYQSIREIKAILEDPRLAAAFPNQAPVTSIEVPDVDVYQIGAGTCSVEVHVVDMPAKPGKPMMVGPRQFTLEFDKPVCASQ